MNDEARLKTWNNYQAAWGPIDEDERRRLLEQSVAADCVYTDPGSQIEGTRRLDGAHRSDPAQVSWRAFQE